MLCDFWEIFFSFAIHLPCAVLSCRNNLTQPLTLETKQFSFNLRTQNKLKQQKDDNDCRNGLILLLNIKISFKDIKQFMLVSLIFCFSRVILFCFLLRLNEIYILFFSLFLNFFS
uniref:(northern house mosquito) hypothetical protein n=1 Tax=Culex pipiens TaxID=7175 RepID=A0A8D8DDU6_CULPI